MTRPLLCDDAPLRYLLSLPADSPPATPRPVLCFLHGYDEAAPHDIHDALTRHGPLRPASWPGAREHFIIIAPQLPGAGDVWHRHADSVRDIVTTVQPRHHGDPARTCLTGFSFGGNGVFDLALLHPGLWAALWPVDPTRVPRAPLDPPVWLSFGSAARRARATFCRALELQDAASLADPAAADRLFLDQGADHVGSAALAYADPTPYHWLLSKRASPAG